MKQEQKGQPNGQQDPVPHKKDANAGSTGFNQGSEQDPDYTDGTPVSDEEKRQGTFPFPLRMKKKTPTKPLKRIRLSAGTKTGKLFPTG